MLFDERNKHKCLCRNGLNEPFRDCPSLKRLEEAADRRRLDARRRRGGDPQGFPPGNIYEVAGRADTDPLFPEDPYIAANRRVTITLMHEAPPVPPGLQP